jgi:hypothetical protein
MDLKLSEKTEEHEKNYRNHEMKRFVANQRFRKSFLMQNMQRAWRCAVSVERSAKKAKNLDFA